MTIENTTALLVFLGAMHLLQLPAMALLVRGPLRLKPDLAHVSPLSRRILLLFVWGLMLLLVGLGSLVALCAEELAVSRFGQWLCLLLGCCFAARAAAHLWLLPCWPRGVRGTAAFFTLGAIYLTLASGYLSVALSFPV
jgi:hypothetical protein